MQSTYFDPPSKIPARHDLRIPAQHVPAVHRKCKRTAGLNTHRTLTSPRLAAAAGREPVPESSSLRPALEKTASPSAGPTFLHKRNIRSIRKLAASFHAPPNGRPIEIEILHEDPHCGLPTFKIKASRPSILRATPRSADAPYSFERVATRPPLSNERCSTTASSNAVADR